MNKPKAGVLVLPGTNCDFDTLHVLKLAGFDAERVWHEERNLYKYSFIVIPGGFSYGDYLRPGAIAHLSPSIMELHEYTEKEYGFVMGICNGFQILTELGLLEGALLRNIHLRFLCMDQEVEIVRNDTPFTHKFNKGERISLPIAHFDGRYYIKDEEIEHIKPLVVLRYINNPNGSVWDIAGITNKKGNVLGLMPHPERNSEKILGTGKGMGFFTSILEEVKRHA